MSGAHRGSGSAVIRASTSHLGWGRRSFCVNDAGANEESVIDWSRGRASGKPCYIDKGRKRLARTNEEQRSLSQFLWKRRFMTPTTGLISKRQNRCGGEGLHSRPAHAGLGSRQLSAPGATDAEILQAYPSLRPSDLAAAYDYADAHRSEIEAAVRRNEEDENGADA